MGDGGCAEGQDEHGRRQCSWCECAERLPCLGHSLGHSVVLCQPVALCGGGEPHRVANPLVLHHTASSGRYFRAELLLHASLVWRPFPGHVPRLSGPRLGGGALELSDVASAVLSCMVHGLSNFFSIPSPRLLISIIEQPRSWLTEFEQATSPACSVA